MKREELEKELKELKKENEYWRNQFEELMWNFKNGEGDASDSIAASKARERFQRLEKQIENYEIKLRIPERAMELLEKEKHLSKSFIDISYDPIDEVIKYRIYCFGEVNRDYTIFTIEDDIDVVNEVIHSYKLKIE